MRLVRPSGAKYFALAQSWRQKKLKRLQTSAIILIDTSCLSTYNTTIHRTSSKNKFSHRKSMNGIREALTPEQRAIDLDLVVDPGFVNHRKIQTILGKSGMKFIDLNIRNQPDLPEWQKKVRIDHIYSEAVLIFCREVGIQTLQHNLATGTGHLFCSVEKLGPCPDAYDKTRVISEWLPPENNELKVEFHYSTAHIHSDTTRSRLHDGNHVFAIVAHLLKFDGTCAIFDPLLMGAPWLREKNEPPTFDIMWYGYDFFENFLEDFDEFRRVKDIPSPNDVEPMRYISESAFKQCIAKILGDAVQSDWGGETSDFYTAHIHLNGKSKTAAFLLKGPARFAPMNLNHLGKKNDQIVRLAKEPAQVLFVQHCHDVTSSVRDTLRAFAVQPGNPRRFCIIDGRDSLRLLKAYDLYDKAVALSRGKKSEG